MNFKDSIAADLNSVFFIAEEFSETVMIEGIEMEIVRDSDSIAPGNKKYQVASFDVVFHVSSSYFDEIPQTEKRMRFNNDEYLIKSVSENMGMLTIGLSRNDL